MERKWNERKEGKSKTAKIEKIERAENREKKEKKDCVRNIIFLSYSSRSYVVSLCPKYYRVSDFHGVKMYTKLCPLRRPYIGICFHGLLTSPVI